VFYKIRYRITAFARLNINNRMLFADWKFLFFSFLGVAQELISISKKKKKIFFSEEI